MIISEFLKQTAVYWGAPIPNGFGGFTYSNPVEIVVRWEERVQMFTSMSGQEKVSQAVVYTESTLTANGYLFLGTLNDLDSPAVPETQEGAYLIEAVSACPSMDAVQTLRKIWL